MRKLIIVANYPDTFSFYTEEELPRFKFDCPIRTKLLRKQLEEQKIECPYHRYEDYNVEIMERFKSGEVWFVGS